MIHAEIWKIAEFLSEWFHFCWYFYHLFEQAYFRNVSLTENKFSSMSSSCRLEATPVRSRTWVRLTNLKILKIKIIKKLVFTKTNKYIIKTKRTLITCPFFIWYLIIIAASSKPELSSGSTSGRQRYSVAIYRCRRDVNPALFVDFSVCRTVRI